MFVVKRRFASFLLQREAVLVVVLAVLIKGSSGLSPRCPGNSSNCILPEPLSAVQYTDDLPSLSVEIRCLLGCVDEYRDGNSVLDENTLWPTLDFIELESDCTIYRKVSECKRGCLERHSDRTSGTNRCRDRCHTECKEELECSLGKGTCTTTSEPSTCPRACRKTYCRAGCELYNSLHDTTSGSETRNPPPSSLAPPTNAIPGSNETKDWMYSVDVRNTLLSTSQNATVSPTSSSSIRMYTAVAYIIKITSNGESHYFWQKNSTQPLDFSSYACRGVSISFAVVSKYSQTSSQELTFSPTTYLCVPGVGGYPSQVKSQSIRVTYTEDERAEFQGYSVANVSWAKPENAQFVTSYTINVYPLSARCGGAGKPHSFRYIDKRLTEFTLLASSDNGLWTFDCSYQIEIVALPTEGPVIGGYVQSTTELTQIPTFEFNCSRMWDEMGLFSVSLSWQFPNKTKLSHIRRFIIIPKLVFKNNGTIIDLFDRSYLQNGGDTTSFSMVTQSFSPQLENDAANMKYTFEVRSERTSGYSWRSTPRSQSCSVLATPLPPRNITSVSIADVTFNRANQSLQMRVDVVPSNRMHGTLADYTVSLRKSQTDCYECENPNSFTFSSSTAPINIRATIPVNESVHCLFLSVRVFNHYNLSSHWSEDLAVPLDHYCDSPLLPSGWVNASRVSVYYEGNGSEKNKVLEFGCSSFVSSPTTTSDNITARLQDVNNRLEAMATRMQDTSREEEREAQLDAKLQRIERKLDSVLDMLQNQGRPAT